jgi:hypothetical protein
MITEPYVSQLVESRQAEGPVFGIFDASLELIFLACYWGFKFTVQFVMVTFFANTLAIVIPSLKVGIAFIIDRAGAFCKLLKWW